MGSPNSETYHHPTPRAVHAVSANGTLGASSAFWDGFDGVVDGRVQLGAKANRHGAMRKGALPEGSA